MTLQQLVYFKEVANTKNFTKASENLYVAQSGLSRSIQILEREIGAPLFIRDSGRKIVLTDYGEAFLPYVEDILDRLNAAKDMLSQMIMPNRGEVSIAYSYVNGNITIPRLFKEFYKDESNSDIQLRSNVNHGGKAYIEEQLMMGSSDLAISCSKFENNKDIKAKKLYKQELFVAVSKDNPLSKKSKLKIEDIKDEYIVLVSETLSLYDHIINLFSEKGIVPKLIDGLNDWSVQMDLISCNRGITITPEIAGYQENICFIPLDNKKNTRDVWMLWATNRKLSPVSKLFRDFCLDYYN